MKIWMTVDKPGTSEVDLWLNYLIEESHVSPVMTTCCSLSDCPCDQITIDHKEAIVCLPWFFPVQLLWQLPIPFGRGMINAIWVCCGVVCLLFCLVMANKRWEPTFWRNNCSHDLVSVQHIWLQDFCFNIILIML